MSIVIDDLDRRPGSAERPAAWMTEFHKAVCDGDADAVRAMIVNGANVSVLDSNGMPPLMRTAFYTHPPENQLVVARLLISSGADVNFKHHKSGKTALHEAAGASNAALSRLLITQGADIHCYSSSGYMPFHEMASYPLTGYEETVDVFISAGATVEDKTKDGLSVLQIAEKSVNKEAFEYLKSKRAAIKY